MAFSQPGFNPGALGLYNQQLGLMTQNYNQILAGYGQGESNIAGQLGGIYQGYNTAERNVLGTLGVTGGGWGVAAPAAKAIQGSFLNTQGQNQQSLINSGLGNSTLLAQSNNQANKMAGDSYAQLGSQLASTAAGYESQFGLARQAAAMQGLGMENSLTQSYLGNLAGYHFSPNVNLYGQYSGSPNGGGYGGGGGSGYGSGSGSGGSPFSNWLMGSGVPAYGGGGGNALGYSGWYANRDPGYSGGGGGGGGGEMYDYSPGSNALPYGGGGWGDTGDFGGGGDF